MPSSYQGRMLRVDLTTGQTNAELACGGDEATLRQYVGGAGLGAKYLYDEVPSGVEWDSPENRLIFISGPLGGTRAPGSGTFTIVTKGPLTNLAAATQANGFFGAYLRFSGFDGVIVQGQASGWHYLYIHDGQAELRDALHLVGKDCWETAAAIKAELGQRAGAASVFGIGPAGENLVKFAGVMGDGGHMAGTNGTGAVMGAKRLKAVVVARGSGQVAVANARRIAALGREMTEDSKANMIGGVLHKWGTAGITASLHETGTLPIKNYETNIFPEYERFTGEYVRTHFQVKKSPCWACQMAHCHRMKVTEGPYAGFEGEEPEYEGFAAFGPLIGVTDPGAAVMLNDLNDRLGMDLKESGFVLSLAAEAYEKGLLGGKTDGLDLSWGNAEALRELLHRIARRQGWLGDVLAEGVMKAGEAIGGGAEKMSIYAKRGIAPHTHQLQNRLNTRFAFALSNSGSFEGGFGGPQMAQELGLPVLSDPYSTDPDEVRHVAAQTIGIRFSDFLNLCSFTSGMYLGPLVEAVNAATGWDMTIEEAHAAGQRIVHLLRAFDIRHGLVPEDEWPSPRMMEPAVDGPLAGKADVSSQTWDRMLRDYYEEVGWDRATGRPLPETLRAFGLDFAVADLWQQEPAR